MLEKAVKLNNVDDMLHFVISRKGHVSLIEALINMNANLEHLLPERLTPLLNAMDKLSVKTNVDY